MQIPGLHHLSAETLADTITETTGRKDCNSKTKNVDVVWHVVPRGCMYIYTQGVPGGMDKTSGECSLC